MKKILFLVLSIIFGVNGYTQNDFSLLFDGVNDLVEIPANSNFDNVTDSLTICAWIKPIGLTGGEGSAIVARRDRIGGASPERTHFMFTVLDDLSLRFYTQNSANNTLYRALALTTDSVVNYGVWNFVAVTFYKGLIKIYSNGNLVYNVDHGVKELFPHNHLISIGQVKRTNDTDFGFFGGMIDELSIWHDDLSDSLITQYMTCPPVGTETNLLSYWKFEEGININTTDETGNGNNGTLMNGTQWFTDVPTKFCSCNSTLFPINNISKCDSAILRGNIYYISQTVYDTVIGTFGCDSVITTNITINTGNSTVVDTTISFNSSLFVGGAIQNTNGTYYDTLSTYNGCDSVIITNLTVDPAGFISDIDNQFNFYPNPSSGKVKINANYSGKIYVHGLEGKLIFEREVKNGLNEVDVSELSKGSYLLMYKSIKGVSTSILVIE